MVVSMLFALSLMGLTQAERTPVEGLISHHKTGDYIDEVQGKPYSCEPKIAFLVDTSPSIGRDLVDKDIVSFLANMETQLARLPRAPGDNRQGSNIHLVIFNKEANDYPLNSRNMSTTRIKRAIQSTLQETPIEGGTCISCGMELANAIIKYHSVSVDSRKYIVLISDGFNNDAKGISSMSPNEAVTMAREDGVEVLTVGIMGSKGAINENMMRSLADNDSRYWKITKPSDTNTHAVDIIDLIAGESCLG